MQKRDQFYHKNAIKESFAHVLAGHWHLAKALYMDRDKIMLGEIGQKFSELDLSPYEKTEKLADIQESEDVMNKSHSNS